MDSNMVTRIRANRHFDQMREGDEIVVDLSDEYWSNQIIAGNISVLDLDPVIGSVGDSDFDMITEELDGDGYDDTDPED